MSLLWVFRHYLLYYWDISSKFCMTLHVIYLFYYLNTQNPKKYTSIIVYRLYY